MSSRESRQSTSRDRSGWRHQRPLVGALLIVFAGVEMFFSTQLDIGKLHIQMGIEGFQATIIPVGFVLLGVLIVAMPQHRIFYGVLALALSIYSIVGVNLGGFIVGMLLSAVGGILVVSWAPRAAVAQSAEVPETEVGMGTASAAASATDATDATDATGATGATETDAVPVGAGARELHAEFAPYSSLVAIARAAELTHVAA